MHARTATAKDKAEDGRPVEGGGKEHVELRVPTVHEELRASG